MTTFRHEDLLGLPAFQNRHAGNGAVRVVLSGRVHDVVRADDDGDIRFREVVVDLVHFQHDVIRHFGFRQQHVHVTGQTACNRVDCKADVLALGAQTTGQLGHVLLGLCHSHTVTGDDDHAVGLFQGSSHTIGIDGNLLAFDFHGRAVRAATKAAKNNRDERAVHRLTHDVGQDRTRRTNQRAHNDQKVVAQREADGRRGPTRVAVQHRHNHRHVGAADAHDQVIADEQSRHGQDNQRQEGCRVQVPDQAHDRDRSRASVQHVTARQLFSRRGHFARQFAVRNDRPGKGHGTDPDAQRQLDQQDVDLDSRFLGDQLTEGTQLFDGIFADGQSLGRVADLEMRVKTHEHSGQTDQCVHASHQFGHLGHFDLRSQLIANDAACCDQRDRQPPQTGAGADQGCSHRQRHADNAIPYRAFRAFLSRQTAKGEDEQNCCNNICSRGETKFHDLYPLTISGTWRACAVSRGSRRKC